MKVNDALKLALVGALALPPRDVTGALEQSWELPVQPCTAPALILEVAPRAAPARRYQPAGTSRAIDSGTVQQ